jgi:hypothetical protein
VRGAECAGAFYISHTHAHARSRCLARADAAALVERCGRAAQQEQGFAAALASADAALRMADAAATQAAAQIAPLSRAASDAANAALAACPQLAAQLLPAGVAALRGRKGVLAAATWHCDAHSRYLCLSLAQTRTRRRSCLWWAKLSCGVAAERQPLPRAAQTS